MREAGIFVRLKKIWSTQDDNQLSNTQQAVLVRLEHVLMAHSALLYGIVVSVVILAFEILIHNVRNCARTHRHVRKRKQTLRARMNKNVVPVV